MKKTPFLILIFIISLSYVNACSCIPPGPPEESLEGATAVFAGKVVDIDKPFVKTSFMDMMKVEFEVSKVWKGPAYTTIFVQTATPGASCGYPFEKGKEYLVYAYGTENTLSANLCSRTRLLSRAQEDLIALGQGNEVLITNKNTLIPLSFSLVILVIVALMIIIIVLIFIIKKLKKKSK